MLVNFDREEVYCFFCNRWLDFHLLWINLQHEGSLTCDENHLVGNEWDQEWRKLCGYEDDCY